MKVVLLAINASWTHSCLAVYYLRNALQDSGHSTQIIELTLKQTQSEILEAIYIAKPDVLCLSVYIWNAEVLKQVIPGIRKLLPKLIIVAGGPEISFNDRTCQAINPDYLITGPGEQALRLLAEQDFTSRDKNIQGLETPLEDIPFPYIESDAQALQGKMIYYEAGRGCACRCIYCLSSLDEKTDHLPVDRVKADIALLLQLKPKVIKFVDRSFNQNKAWSRAIWQHVIGLETKVPFHFEVHPDWLEAHDLEILLKAPKGRLQFEVGIQSIHPPTLKAISRTSDWHKVKANLTALRSGTSIPLHTDLIVGLPGESMVEIISSINAVLPLQPHELQLGFLKVLQGTALAKQAAEQGYIWSDSPPYNVLQTPFLSFEDILHLEKIAFIINQDWNKEDFPTVWQAALKWREAYLCLRELLNLTLMESTELHSLERVKRFEVMAKWISSSWQDERIEYLSDALKWDWCRKAGESWYPATLKGGSAIEFRKEHYNTILDWLKSEYWQNETWNHRRFIVFSATSSDFCQEYLEGYSKAVFVSVEGADNACVIYKKQF